MSTSSGGCGAFGILLSEVKNKEVTQLLKEIQDWLSSEGSDEDDGVCPTDFQPDELDEMVSKKFGKRVEQILRRMKIVTPKGASMVYTGDSEDRPAFCGTPSEDWVFGFGIFTLPWEWPKMHKTFRKHAKFHDWSWMG